MTLVPGLGARSGVTVLAAGPRSLSSFRASPGKGRRSRWRPPRWRSSAPTHGVPGVRRGAPGSQVLRGQCPRRRGFDRLLSAAEQRDYDEGLHAGIVRRAAPRRVVRGIVFARLANFIEGHSGVSPPSWSRSSPRCWTADRYHRSPRYGNGGAGEIQALGWLFADLRRQLSLGAQRGHGADQRLAVCGGAARPTPRLSRRADLLGCARVGVRVSPRRR